MSPLRPEFGILGPNHRGKLMVHGLKREELNLSRERFEGLDKIRIGFIECHDEILAPACNPARLSSFARKRRRHRRQRNQGSPELTSRTRRRPQRR